MTIGPFTTYAPPGVYTQTILDPVVGQLLGGLRVPVLIGVGQETLTQTDVEMIRGSSSFADTPIFGEDPTGRWVVGGAPNNPVLGSQDGGRAAFRVRNYPIVDGGGTGKVDYDVSKVSVSVNGQQTVVSQVDGLNGIITLLVPPAPGDNVSVNYFFHRKDTRIVDGVSSQVTTGAAILVAPKTELYVIQAGTNDVLEVFVNDSATSVNITLTAGTRAASDIATDVIAAAVPGLSASVHIDAAGLSHVQLIASGNVRVGSGTADGVLGFNPGDSTGRNKSFRVFNGPIVDGSDGGITTTDTSKVVVLVNGLQVIPASVDGANSNVTLQAAPFDGSTVTVQYWFNTWQDTFDYLPNSNVVSVGNVGIAPGRRDYLNGPDFTIVNDGDQSKIVWGTSWQVLPGETTGSTPFDSTQVVGMLVDNRIFGVPVARYTDPTTNAVSTTTFVLPLKATTGNGRDTPLGTSLYQTITNGRIDLPTNRPDLVTVYVGKSFRDAYSRPAVTVLDVDSSTNLVTLKTPVPADLQAFATFWYNTVQDDTYILTVVTPGPSGVGTYTLSSQLANGAPLFGVKFGTKNSLPQIVQWPSGSQSLPDALYFGGSPVAETVTVGFHTSLLPATHASFSNANADPYSIYSYTRLFGGVVIDGNAPVSVDLSAAYKPVMLGQPIATPFTALPSTARLSVQVDGIIVLVDVSTLTSLSTVVTAINAAIDADTQVHPDGSATFLSSAPNALASAVSYGAQSILKIVGRSTQSATNGLVSNVKIQTPTGSGQTNAAVALGLTPNLEVDGSYSAINQPAELVGTKLGAYNIVQNVNDLFLFGIDGQDYTAVLPNGTAVPVAAVVNYVNAGYAATAPAAGQAAALAAAITFANDIKAKYNLHIPFLTSHGSADSTNIVTATNATTLASLLTLCADIKAKFNAHIIDVAAAVHNSPDATNTITETVPTDLPSAMRFLYNVSVHYAGHIANAVVHNAADVTHVLTTANAVLVARVGLGIQAGFVVLDSLVNDVSSVVAISSLGSANSVLGFQPGSVTRLQPSASDIASALNYASAFNALGVAYNILAPGLGNFLSISSRTAGSTSTISFTNVSNSAFVTDTGIGIVPGVSGDSGEAAQSGFQVSSSTPGGSSGIGIPGQTYTDAVTGLRFTVLPASAGDYADGGSFTLVCSSTFAADASIPVRAVDGLEMTVFNTLGMAVGTTALVTTFEKGGSEPAVGDIYYASYQYAKTDLSTQLFSSSKTIIQNFGSQTPDFPLSLAAAVAQNNGAVLVGLKQVLKVPGTSQASVGAYKAAIDEQRKPIQGSVKPDVITPLGTDPEIFGYLNQHCVFMSSPRQEGERIGVVGPAAGTNPLGVTSIAQSLASELMVVSYPDAYVLSVQDNSGNTFDQLVDATYMAAALAGASCNPSVDVATPWTRRQVFGFKKLGRVLDPTEANQVAVNGVSIIEQVDAGMRVRHGLTTNVQNVITRTPSVTLTIQFVQQSIRRVLDPYIGQKFTGSLIKTVENALVGLFSTLIDQQIVQKVAGIAVSVDDNDPTIMRTEAIYVPVFPLEYITSTLQVRIRI
jgi:hypothetical protein